jgi:hypothetical protein
MRSPAVPGVNTTTVRRHITAIMARLHVTGRFAAGAAAQRLHRNVGNRMIGADAVGRAVGSTEARRRRVQPCPGSHCRVTRPSWGVTG